MKFRSKMKSDMLKRMRRYVALVLGTLLIGGVAYAQTATSSSGSLQSQIDQNDAQISQLNAQIAQYQAQITQDESSKQTLQTTINALNLQVKEVQAQVSSMQKQINVSELKIQQLGTGIQTAQQQIGSNRTVLADGIRTLAETDTQSLLSAMLSSNTLADAWQDAEQNLEVQDGIQTQVTELQSQKADLTASQTASQQAESQLSSQKKQLTGEQASLTSTENQKKQLLAETKSSEATYQQLLSQAEAELQSFSTFAQNATSKGILTNQTSCDSWGCYYNQRDSQWGDDPLDGTLFTMKSDGCLVTAMAMVMTHYGYNNVTPLTINDNPADFAAYYPADLLVNDVAIGGVSVTRVPIGTKQSAIDAILATGNPVIVGIHAYGGTHFIVFTSGSKGNYIMRDPYQPNAKDIPFTQYYSLSEIFSAAKVVIG